MPDAPRMFSTTIPAPPRSSTNDAASGVPDIAPYKRRVLCSLKQRRAKSLSKTAREAISKFLLAFQSDADKIEQNYRDLVTTLDDAGFVILPKKPTSKMIGAVTLWDYANGEGATGDDVAEIYGEMVNAALQE
jgi:hypothetical protein